MKNPALLLAGLAALVSVAAHAETLTFHATMSPKSEVPPKTTDGKGTAEASLDTATKVLTYTVTFSGLTGPATMGHLHGPADPGANAGVLVPFAQPVTSPVHGTATLTDAQVTDLESGKMYANIHTAANPGGELRGQLVK
jgi:hypothetical protein